MPDLGSFEVFLAIAETGSLGSAARELGLTQQAVSRRLASMEAKVGVRLAARTSRGSSPISAGIARCRGHLGCLTSPATSTRA
jgi:DNA-binding transcriptional LysR family regulator